MIGIYICEGLGIFGKTCGNVMIYVALKEIVEDFGLIDKWVCQRSLRRILCAFLAIAEIRQ